MIIEIISNLTKSKDLTFIQCLYTSLSMETIHIHRPILYLGYLLYSTLVKVLGITLQPNLDALEPYFLVLETVLVKPNSIKQLLWYILIQNDCVDPTQSLKFCS